MILQANGSQSGYSNTQTKQNSNPQKVTSEKDVHYVMIKMAIQED